MISEHNSLGKSISDTASLLAVFDKMTGKFRYHSDTLAEYGKELADHVLWDHLCSCGIISRTDADEIKKIVFSLDENNSVFYKVYSFGVKGKYIMSFTYTDEKVVILLKLFDQGDLDSETIKYDEITRLINRNQFCSHIEELNCKNPDNKYSLFYFDINKFKAINDLFGFEEGDLLLRYIADLLRSGDMPIVCACRVSADRFSFLADTTNITAESISEHLISKIKKYDLPFDISLNIGVYTVPKTAESGNSMLDKATLAQSVIKGNYTVSVNFYSEKLRDEMLSEQEISGEMATALAEEQFVVYFQPQYNHSTGMLVGAEALVRWLHPQKGMISPARFIPIFEKNGFITNLDYYVFEKAAKFVRRSIDNNYSIVPISVNFSKHDVFSPNFVETLELIRTRLGVPSKYLRIEITESILMGNNRAVNEIMSKLHSCGYIVEMDDFGSGYSSLNVLKDLDFDIIKLDMLFLENESDSNRGGTILSSVVNMAKWLHIPVIAEGVETIEQADFLKSIGCDYIQGYLYSRPLPEKDYEDIVSQSSIGALLPQMKLIETLNSANFWEPSSQETLIFSNFVGAAAIFNYDRNTKKIEILRVNKKYLRELGMNLSEKDVLHMDPSGSRNDFNREIYIQTLENAIETGDEQECETWCEIHSDCCGTEQFCIRSNITVIGRSDDHILFYEMIRNITSEKRSYSELAAGDHNFKVLAEQMSAFFWEYNILTHEMRPCFRCMRELGLPPLIRNYPESAYEMGIFPPETREMYFDWMDQLANGAKELEAIIPLTLNRVPFLVRYTTEFDENGHPIKAYGSATPAPNCD